ncbi:sigma factor-like helix-turn-helix DNA-binding protein [Romboutsia sp. 1001285H_161024_C4]|uniref:sigma factor-like helix-turn-helix DNA-binding protein n=1 Tax=Romboutsia sp. 1001285H_161024_C4 TaxID=2787109 RepID=UPI00189B0A0B|nr:sigma factor-like helix-turn-helix DNA-binding protein [Romboutsia sp. 1001285H_161024_C4]
MKYYRISRDSLEQIINEEICEAKERIIERINSLNNGNLSNGDSEGDDFGRTPLPQNEKYEKTLKLIREGKSQSEVARSLNVSIQTVRRYVTWLIINGYISDENTSKLTDRELQVAKLIYDENKSLGEVAREMGCSLENIKLMNDNISSKGYVSNPFIKLIYPGFLNNLEYGKIGFPKNRRKLAEQISRRVRDGENLECFIYLTTPIKKVVALVKITSEMEVIRDQERWPYQFKYEFIIRPKDGVSLIDAGINKRCRPGDTVISMSNEISENLKELLNSQEDLTDEDIQAKVIDNK